MVPVGLVDQGPHCLPHGAVVEPRVLLEAVDAALELPDGTFYVRNNLVHNLQPQCLNTKRNSITDINKIFY